MSILEHYKQFIGPLTLKRQARTQNDEWETVWGTTSDETIYWALLPIGRSLQARINNDVNLVRVSMVMRTETELEAKIDDIVVKGWAEYKIKWHKPEYDPETWLLDHHLYYLEWHE